MCEIVLLEWHVTPEYMFRMWTEEKLQMLIEGRNKRLAKARKKSTGEDETVTDVDLFKRMGYVVPVVNARSGVN